MKKTYFLAALTIFFWSTISTVSKLLLDTMSSYRVLLVSSFFAFLTLFFLNFFRGNLKKMKTYGAKDWLILSLIGLPGTFFYYIFLYAGTARMEPSQAFIINYLWPIMSVVFAILLLKEKMTARKAIAILLSFCGVAVVAGEGLVHFSEQTLLGALFCVMAAISYGLFTALNQRFSYDKSLAMMVFFLISFLGSLGLEWATGEPFALDWAQIGGLAWNGVFVMGAASTLWAMALESGHTAKISNLAYITPFLSLVWNYFALGDVPSPFVLIGLAVIIFGILIQLKEKQS